VKIGIFGFPKVGKTTIFNTLAHREVEVSRFSGKRSDPNIGVIPVPDSRLDRLKAMHPEKKMVSATMEYVDVAGLQRGELKESVDLQALRTVDALAHVVRAFRDDDLPHSEGSIEPARDIQAMEEELILADLLVVENRLDRLAKDRKKMKDPAIDKELDSMARLKEALENGKPLRAISLPEEEERALRGYAFLSLKPILAVVNVGEEDLQGRDALLPQLGLAELSAKPKTAVAVLCGKLEMEISRLSDEDAKLFLEDAGLAESGMERVIQTSYRLFDLITFFTTDGPEVRAWPVRKGTQAALAAGEIHSDIERGFIRAEVVPASALFEAGSMAAAREHGLLRLEGRDYVVQEGDVIHFRFHV
jgi:GTP-binding protein YchF